MVSFPRKYPSENELPKMLNFASASSGAQVVLASSTDDRHPPENIIDGNPDTYWVTTGMYPQEVVISLPSPLNVTTILLKTSNVCKLCIEKSKSTEIKDFELLTEKELGSQDGQMQSEEFKLESPTTARHLKLTVAKGFNHFITVHSVTVNGIPIQ